MNVLQTMMDTSVDSCISDFPYDLSFMGKKWDNTGDFYVWNKHRAQSLYRVIKPGGYVAIFGHPKTNHRMKCAFEDSGFRIVDEIDWIYLTGMPKNQDIGKLFDKAKGIKRPLSKTQRPIGGKNGVYDGQGGNWGETINIPQTDLAVKWNGWKTAGLKPAHEPITIFQKPTKGTYIQNIEKYGCGGMNIDVCRIPYKEDINGVGSTPLEQTSSCVKEQGRFPANIILDEFTAQILDEQTSIAKSLVGLGGKSERAFGMNFHGTCKNKQNASCMNGLSDMGAGSHMFLVIKYCPKVSPSERKLPCGERNPHVTLKPIELIKWLIKLLTPIDGKTIDIASGSGTHGVACEELNRNEGYNLKWIDIEIMNTESEPYCDISKERLDSIIKNVLQ